MNFRILSWTAGLALTALSAAGWGGSELSDDRALADRAAADLSAARQSAARIEILRTSVTSAGKSIDVGKSVEAALTAADIDPDKLAHDAAQPPRRVGETTLVEMPTGLVLRGVTLEQALKFTTAVSADGLTVRDFHLSASADETAGDEWDAEIVVSYVTAGEAK